LGRLPAKPSLFLLACSLIPLSNMRATPIQTLAILVFLLALGTLILAMVVGGDVLMIVFGLALAATSMELFRRAQPRPDDED